MRPPEMPHETPYFVTFIEGRRGEILDAALEVFTTKGYDAGTMREVASRIGVTEPALYRHYASKEELFADVIASAGDAVTERVGRYLDEIEPADLRRALIAMITARMGENRPDGNPPRIMQTLMVTAPRNKTLFAAFKAHFALPMVGNVRALVTRMNEAFGRPNDEESVERQVRVFMSLMVGYFATAKVLPPEAGHTAIIDAMMASMGWNEA